MVYLQVSFVVEAHNVNRYQTFYAQEFRPVIAEHGLEAVGIWKTLVGKAGEFTEIWRFRDLVDFDTKWKSLMADPRVHRIFETTGPIVKNESFKLMELADFMETPV